MNFKELTSFNKMITPTIIKIIFWIGTGLSVLTGLTQIAIGASSPFGGGFQVFIGILTILIGPLLTRIYCELMIVIFKMQESLHNIDSILIDKNNSNN